jgi:hypothetical protein
MAVFWVVAPCSLVEVYLHHQGSKHLSNVDKLPPDYRIHGATTQKTVIFILAAVKT